MECRLFQIVQIDVGTVLHPFIDIQAALPHGQRFTDLSGMIVDQSAQVQCPGILAIIEQRLIQESRSTGQIPGRHRLISLAVERVGRMPDAFFQPFIHTAEGTDHRV